MKDPAELAEKPTVNDIARVAGVSLATVDRVLNERPGVRSKTIEKVQKAIAKIGYVRDTAAANLARRRVYNLLYILPDTTNEFVGDLEAAIAEQGEKLLAERTRLRLAKAPPDPLATAELLDRVDPETTDGVAIFAPETPTVRDAVRRLRERGVAVAALVSDLPSADRNHFVGIDNVAAGRTAGELMGRFVAGAGKVLVVTGSRLSRHHLERRQGFDLVICESFPELEVMASLDGQDDPERLARLLPRVLDQQPDLRGIYSSAAENAGLVRILRDHPRARELVVVSHELTATSRDALKDGVFDAVINQDTGHLVRSAVRLLKATADNVPFNPTQERIRIDIYLKENLPPVGT